MTTHKNSATINLLDKVHTLSHCLNCFLGSIWLLNYSVFKIVFTNKMKGFITIFFCVHIACAAQVWPLPPLQHPLSIVVVMPTFFKHPCVRDNPRYLTFSLESFFFSCHDTLQAHPCSSKWQGLFVCKEE